MEGSVEINVERLSPTHWPALETIQVQVAGSDTVQAIKNKIQERWHIAPGQQLLSPTLIDARSERERNSKPAQLEDEVRAEDGSVLRERVWNEFNIPAGATLHLTDFTELTPVSRTPRVGTSHSTSLQHWEALLAFVDKRCMPSGTLLGWFNRETKQPLKFDSLDIYNLVDWVIRPATYDRRCSYAELVAAAGGIIPADESEAVGWYVVHHWADALVNLVQCLREHARLRELWDSPAYWICASSVNQHQLGARSGGTGFVLSDTPFFHALLGCRGVLLSLDRSATATTRLWCMFEVSLATVLFLDEARPEPALLDLMTTVHNEVSAGGGMCVGSDCRPALIADGLLPHEARLESQHAGQGLQEKAAREALFPVAPLILALNLDVAHCQCSRSEDTRRLLNCLAGISGRDADDMPPRTHPIYEKISTRLRGVFAAAGWCAAVHSKSMILSHFGAHIREDIARQRLRLHFGGCRDSLCDSDMADLGQSLHPRLEELEIDASLCSNITDAALAGIAEGMPRGLRVIRLSFRGCSAVGSRGFAAIAAALPESLHTVELNFDDTALHHKAVRKVRSPAALAGLFDHRDARIREAAVATLGKRRAAATRYASAFAERLTDESAAVVAGAARVLGRLGSAAVAPHMEALSECLGDPECAVRRDAAKALLNLPVESLPIPALAMAALARHGNANLRKAAEEVFPTTADEERAEALVMLLRHRSTDVREVAARYFCRVEITEGSAVAGAGQQLADCLDDKNPRVREAASIALGQFGAAAAPHTPGLADCLGDRVREVHRSAALAMLKLPVDIISPKDWVLASLLRHGCMDLHTKADVALRALGNAASTAAVAANLSHRKVDVREAAARAIGLLGAGAIPHSVDLADRLGDGNSTVRAAAAEAFLRLAADSSELPPRTWVVASIARHGNPRLYKEAHSALRKLSDSEWAAQFASVLSHENCKVREAAVRALGKLRAEAVVHLETLSRLLVDENGSVREAAAWAVGETAAVAPATVAGPHTSALVERLSDPVVGVRRAVAQALVRVPAEAFPPQAWALAATVQHETPELAKVARRYLRQELGHAGRAAAFAAVLNNENSKVRAAALRELSEASVNERHVTAIAGCLDDEDPEVRCAATVALSKLGTLAMPHTTKLAACFEGDCDGSVREAAATAIGELGATSIRHSDNADHWAGLIATLAAHLGDVDAGVRIAVVQALGLLGHAAAPRVPGIARRLNDDVMAVADSASSSLNRFGSCAAPYAAAFLDAPRWEARVAAAQALEQLGESAEPHVQALSRCLADPVVDVRRAASRTLLLVSSQSLCPSALALGTFARHGNEDLQARAEAGLRRLDPQRRAAAFVALLNHQDRHIREEAARGLSQIGPAAAPHAADIAMRLADSDAAVRALAARALGSIGASAASVHLGALVERLTDGDSGVRGAAVTALGQLGHVSRPYLPDIEHCLGDREGTVRRAAAAALELLEDITTSRVRAKLGAVAMGKKSFSEATLPPLPRMVAPAAPRNPWKL